MRHLFLPLAFIALSLNARAQETDKRLVPMVVGFYNLENLFDTIDQPDVDDKEFLPDGADRWTSERYHEKLQHMARVIGEMGTKVRPDGIAVLGVSEVENGGVLNDLVHTSPLAERGFRYISHEGPDARGVDVGLLYNPKYFTVLAQKAYRLTMPDDSTFKTRDQLLVTGVLDGDTISIIVNHWPSRRGGEKRSAPKRAAAADLGRHIVDSLLARNPNARILHMGDLNDDPIDASMQKHLRVVGDKQHVNGTLLYDPMMDLYQKGIGSLAWQDSWNLLDQISLSPELVTGAGGRYSYHSVHIFNEPYLRQKDGAFAGYPLRTYVGTEYQGGYSDHFPVFVVLTREL